MNSFRIFTQRLRPAFITTASTNTSRMSTQELINTYGSSVFKGLAVAGIGGVVLSKLIMTRAHAESGEPKKVFGRAGPTFTRLTLESSEEINHNTKRLRFALPSDDAITGLPLTCEFAQRALESIYN